MNYHERPTPLQEQANAEAMQHFAEHLKQFKANCDAIHNIESNLPATVNDAFRAALQSSGHIIQTDDGTQWQHAVDLTKITSVLHNVGVLNVPVPILHRGIGGASKQRGFLCGSVKAHRQAKESPCLDPQPSVGRSQTRIGGDNIYYEQKYVAHTTINVPAVNRKM
jgi:hypothetical protein